MIMENTTTMNEDVYLLSKNVWDFPAIVMFVFFRGSTNGSLFKHDVYIQRSKIPKLQNPLIEQWKKHWLLRVYRLGDEILPSYVGIIIDRYKDPH